MVMATFTAVALMACCTPHVATGRASDLGAPSLTRHPGPSAASYEDEGEEQRPTDIILTAGGTRPPPKPPPLPPRPPGRINPRDKENPPVQPGRVPGRRLAGPPDAPYWEQVFEIQWRGTPLQGPQALPPATQQPGQPTSRPAQTSRPGPNATSSAERLTARFDPSRAEHIFRDAAGHVSPASAESQARFARLFEHIASNPANLRADAVQARLIPPQAAEEGMQAFTWTGRIGQVWVTVRNGVIQNAGVNMPGAFR